MKRWILLSLLFLITFAAGFASALFLVSERTSYEERHFRESIVELRQRIYGQNFFHHKGSFPEIEAQLAAFDPARSTGSITLSYVGGIGGGDHHLRLQGDGRLFAEVHGSSQLISTIPHDRCTAFFHRVLTSGVLNYSEGVVELKKDLLPPNSLESVTDRSYTEIRISIPELKTEQTVSIYAPNIELESFPDIIELQLVTQIEKEILDLVPKDYPLWK